MIASVTLSGAEAWAGFLGSIVVVVAAALRVRSFILKKVVDPLVAISGTPGRPPLTTTVAKQGESLLAMESSLAALTVSVTKVERVLTSQGGRPMKEAVDRIEHKLDDHMAAYAKRDAVISAQLSELEARSR